MGRLAQLPDLFFGQTPTKASHRMDAEPHRGQQQRLDPAGTKQQVRTNQVSVNGSGAIGDEPLVLSDLEYQLTSARPEDGRVLGDRLVRPRFRDSQKGLHRSTRTSTHTQQSLRGKGSWGTSACHFPLANTNSTALTSGTPRRVSMRSRRHLVREVCRILDGSDCALMTEDETEFGKYLHPQAATAAYGVDR